MRDSEDMSTKSYEWSGESLEELKRLEKRYPRKEALMLPALWLIQREEGYIPPEAVESVARYLEVPPSKVYGVLSFYSMFSLEKRGRYHLELCKTLSCSICGGGEVLKKLMEILKIEPGEKSSDGLFSLEEVECLGACAAAPVMQIGDELHENLTPESVERLVGKLKEGEDA
jgi:NADH-quinone oxidoreductase subunit E